MEDKIKFNVEILKWAIKESGLNVDDIVKKSRIKKEKIEKWLSEKDLPTYKQLYKLAEALNIPFGYFFLREIPAREKIEIPDLRQTQVPLTRNFYEIYYDVKRKQDWIKLKREKEGYMPLDFVGKYDLNIEAEDIVKDIKEVLEITEKDFDKPFNLIEKAERKGIFVIKNSILLNNHHIKLNPVEFRGFVIVDRFVPMIFINGADSTKTQILTLFHMLSHIWIGESGICDVNMENTNEVEKLCNQVAVSILEWIRDDRQLKEDHYIRNSKAFTLEVLNSLQSGELLYKEAVQLLNIKVETIKKILSRLP